MKIKSFISKFNCRLICVHLLATAFILLSSKRFALLYDFDFTESFFNFGFPEYLKHLHPKYINETIGDRLSLFLWTTYLAKLIGLLLSFIVSLIIILKRKIFWMNAIIVLI